MTSKKLNRRSVVAGMAAATGVMASGMFSPRRAYSQTAPIKIGCIQTLSGAMAQIGNSHIIGAQIAVDMINDAGGIDGRQVELDVRDTQISAATAVAALREFSGQGTNLVMGEAFSSVNLAAVPLLQELDLVMASPSAVAMELTHEMFTPNFFRCGPNAYMQYNGQTRLLAQEFPDLRKWGGMQTDGAGFKSGWDMMVTTLKRNTKEINGADVTVNDPIITKLGATDFRTTISQLLGQDLEGVFFQAQGQDALNFIRQSEPFGFFDNVGAIAGNNFGASAGAMSIRLPDNYVASAYWSPLAYDEVAMKDEFLTRYRNTVGMDEIDVFATMSHTAIMGFAEAIRQAGSTATADVVAAMESTPFDCLHGALTYRMEDHQLELDGGYVILGPPESGTGFETKRFVTIPVDEIIEPATPGEAFVL